MDQINARHDVLETAQVSMMSSLAEIAEMRASINTMSNQIDNSLSCSIRNLRSTIERNTYIKESADAAAAAQANCAR